MQQLRLIRGGLFKKMVLKMYNNSCCITGMHIESVYGDMFIDACYIVPFSLTHNDIISNGIALCPNLHRAFDRGLITIDSGYRVIVSDGVIENAGHPYNLKQFNGMAIHLHADSAIILIRLIWNGMGGMFLKGFDKLYGINLLPTQYPSGRMRK